MFENRRTKTVGRHICNATYDMWKRTVHDRIKHEAFLPLTETGPTNKKTRVLSYSKLTRAPYLTRFKPEYAGMVFEERESWCLSHEGKF